MHRRNRRNSGDLDSSLHTRHWLASYDAFSTVPQELAEGTPGGMAMTMVAAGTCVVLFLCEVTAFLTAKPSTRIVLDSNQDELLRVNFDVHFFDLACDHVTVGVWDSFGTDKQNITKNVQKQRIDHAGSHRGEPYTEDELNELEFNSKTFTQEELAELDADWSSTSDNFKHDDFSAVVNAHDFTFINFYADWCPHCQMFAPTWTKFEDAINKGSPLKDADGADANVRVLRINCVDFQQLCQDQRIGGFPTLRIYSRGAKEDDWAEYGEARDIDSLTNALSQSVKQKHLHAGAKFHDIFTEGCRVSGYLEVARVPGTVHFQAKHPKDRNLNLAFTNVSHLVHHFSFGQNPRRSISALPAEYKRHVNPLDGKAFISDKFHMAPHHYIKVVHTRFEASNTKSYQQTHQWNLRMVKRKDIPQAQFSYDLAPVEAIITKGERRWYDFLTSCLGIIGGAFSSISLLYGILKFGYDGILSLAKES